MEDAPVIAGLLEKRAEIERAIAELERQIRKHRADRAQLDATIGLFAPNVVEAKRRTTRFKRSVYFVTGELTRRCLDALREAGEPVTIEAIAIATLRDKGLDVDDKALRVDFERRFLWTLNRMLLRGAVTKDGYGAGARWGLPS